MNEQISDSLANAINTATEALENKASTLKEFKLRHWNLTQERNKCDDSFLAGVTFESDNAQSGITLHQSAKDVIKSTLAELSERIMVLLRKETSGRVLGDRDGKGAMDPEIKSIKVQPRSAVELLIELGMTLYDAADSVGFKNSWEETIDDVTAILRTVRALRPLAIEPAQFRSDVTRATWFWTGIWGYWICRNKATKDHALNEKELTKILGDLNSDYLLAWCGQMKWTECDLSSESIAKLKSRVPRSAQRQDWGASSMNSTLTFGSMAPDDGDNRSIDTSEHFLRWILK